MPADRPRPRPTAPRIAPRLQDPIRLSADGPANVPGDLEARVLAVVRGFGVPVPARAVHEAVVREHPVAPLTVTTVLDTLVDERFLVRHTVDDLLHYAARLTRETFVAHVNRRVAEGGWRSSRRTSWRR